MKGTALKYSLAIILIISISISFNSCSSSSTQQSTSWNLASIYNPLKSNLHPAYKVFHNSTNTSILFLKLRTSELYFRPNPTSNREECSFTLIYLLQKISDEGNSIVDSNTYVYEFHKSDLNDYYITQIPIQAQEGNSYRIKVTLRDNNRKSFSINYLEIEKHPEYAEQYFNLTSLNGTPIFRNVLVNNGAFRINHSNPNSDKLYISYFKDDGEAAKPLIPPRSDENIYKKYDSIFVVDYNNKTALSLEYQGLYFVQFDTNSSQGISILKLNTDFPKVEEPEGLLPPLTYITGDAEYKKLFDGNPKLAADNFWIKAGGSTGKGREMIRLYYNRVYFSNYYFTNTKPGWKTDRGMIYIVYGPPHKIKKTAEKEIWIYERKGDNTKITFTFVYSPNKYSLNKFLLQRSESHEWHWTEAIYAWTTGDIFLYD